MTCVRAGAADSAAWQLPHTHDDHQEESDEVDAAASALLARSRALLMERGPIEQRIQAALQRFNPHEPSHVAPGSV
jgi:hypothetical protein